MNSIVALPLAGVPTSDAQAAAAPDRKPTKEEVYAYAEWLSNEHRLLMHELGEPERFSPVGTAARAFHFPSSDRTWEDIPKPSTRCLSVLAAIGVDASKSDWLARGVASQDPDPIFAAIDAHRAARAVWLGWVYRHSDLEDELPKEVRRSFVHEAEEEIFDTDDPRWIECEQSVHRTHDEETDAAIGLLDVRPATHAGVVALLEYAVAADTDGMGFPDLLVSDDGEMTRSWQFFLIESVAGALAEMTGQI
jgi:hypothetical protein